MSFPLANLPVVSLVPGVPHPTEPERVGFAVCMEPSLSRLGPVLRVGGEAQPGITARHSHRVGAVNAAGVAGKPCAPWLQTHTPRGTCDLVKWFPPLSVEMRSDPLSILLCLKKKKNLTEFTFSVSFLDTCAKFLLNKFVLFLLTAEFLVFCPQADL